MSISSCIKCFCTIRRWALVLIDPTRGRAAMDEARDWNKRLEKHLGASSGNSDRAVKLLVGAKVDQEAGPD